MSFDLITTTGGSLPDFLRKIGYQDTGLGANIAPKAPKMGMTQAKEFTWTEDGQKMLLPDRKFRAIIVAAAENISKAWYEKGFQPGSNDAPDCYSRDAKVPDPGCKSKQAASCATCPKNAFGSNRTSGRGKDCSDRKMIVIAWENQPDKFATMNIPTMSLTALKNLDTRLRDANIPLQAVLCEFSFDPRFTYPVLEIGAVGFVDEKTAVKFIEASKSEEVKQLLREVEGGEEAPAAKKEEPPVPAQVIDFGKATGVSQAEPQPEPEKPKRTRQTKPKEEPQATPEPQAMQASQEVIPGAALEEEEEESGAADLDGTPVAGVQSNVMDLLKKWGK